MADITKRAGAVALTQLMREPGWEIVMRLLAKRIVEIQGQETTGNDAFQTLRTLHKNQGKVEGLKDFFNDIEKGAFED